jgi:hypothetical protein
MKNRIFFPLIAFCSLLVLMGWTEEKPRKIFFEKGPYRCEYEVADGMYNGTYTSWYANGTKRAEGTFLHNMRHGLWTVYDSTGRTRMVRKYQNNFEFELIFPKPSGEGPIPLLRQPKYTLTYSDKGYIPYCYLEERAVWASKRIWRYIPARADHPLFANDHFYHALIDSVILGDTKVFAVYADDDFRQPFSVEQKQQLADTVGRRVVGFKIVEDWFFDRDRMLSESRIIGICPVYILAGAQPDTLDLGWFYFPALRNTLARQPVTTTGVPEYVRTLDDVFFFRYFHSSIDKESNVYNRTLKENTSGMLGLAFIMEQRRVEISIIETEHDAWIFFTE